MDLSGLSVAAISGLALTSFLIELTPGPNMAYLAVVAATEGRKPGFAAVAGVALGLLIVGLLAAFGLAALITAEPYLYQALRWTGVGYLLWLAWDGWRTADEVVDIAGPGSSLSLYFRRGLITNLLNPKAAVFYLAVLPTFVDQSGAILGQTVAFSLIYVAVATAIHGLIVALAGATRGILAHPKRSQIMRRILAVCLAAVAVWFAWKTRG